MKNEIVCKTEKKNNGTKRKKQSKTKQKEKWIDFNCQSAFCQEDFRVFLLGIVIRCSNGGHCTKYVLNCDISNWSFVMCIIPFYIWKPKPFAVSLSRISAIGGNWMRQKYFNHSTEPKKQQILGNLLHLRFSFGFGLWQGMNFYVHKFSFVFSPLNRLLLHECMCAFWYGSYVLLLHDYYCANVNTFSATERGREREGATMFANRMAI